MLLITGSTGFIGQHLTSYLLKHNLPFAVAVRVKNVSLPTNIQQFIIGKMSPTTDWSDALQSVDTIIHLAGRAHIMNDQSASPMTEFRNVNTSSTLILAEQAAKAGVKRLIFLSSIKVNGEASFNKPFTADDSFVPTDPYGLSKYEAELELKRISQKSGLQVVVIRPPLVYGQGVKGNLRSMLKWINKGYPLPLGAIHNKRSLVSVDNLIDLIVTCIDHPNAANQTFLVSDDQVISTTELLKQIAQAHGKSANLIPVPQFILEFAFSIIGKKSIAERLCGNLQVDIQKTKDVLGWKPPVSLQEGFRRIIKK